MGGTLRDFLRQNKGITEFRMKKCISIVLATALCAATAAADVALGIRGTAQWGLGTTTGGTGDLDYTRMWSFGGSIYGKIPISVVPHLYVQPEMGFAHHSVGYKNNGGKYALTYNALEFPVLMAYDFPINQAFAVTVECGPQFSVVMGKAKVENAGVEANPKSRMLFSAVIGGGISYAFTSGMSMVVDMRYDLGFNSLDYDRYGYGVTPRGLSISTGFQVRF